MTDKYQYCYYAIIMIDALRRVVLWSGAWTKEAVNRQLQGQEGSSSSQGPKGTGAQARTDEDRLQAPEVPLTVPPTRRGYRRT